MKTAKSWIARLDEVNSERDQENWVKAIQSDAKKYHSKKARRLKRANDVLMDFINREMRMTGNDPRIDDLARRLAAVSNSVISDGVAKPKDANALD